MCRTLEWAQHTTNHMHKHVIKWLLKQWKSRSPCCQWLLISNLKRQIFYQWDILRSIEHCWGLNFNIPIHGNRIFNLSTPIKLTSVWEKSIKLHSVWTRLWMKWDLYLDLPSRGSRSWPPASNRLRSQFPTPGFW